MEKIKNYFFNDVKYHIDKKCINGIEIYDEDGLTKYDKIKIWTYCVSGLTALTIGGFYLYFR